ncbi:hypothetical protein SAMN05216294_3128 [Flagellimonas zhangzhouensis]|uniref:Uncharacterized protein n=1 Tax=Flagellimonas zhangzhouensis TaxID=1073328 RepID=A0A1H2YNB9_9FLAO|nr:hypothetical protein SAMN05216294_3128 [Allomuricauda zhangzhouensis]SDX06742.1 hypothetical protein SAMN04487892_3135 [Allomuricauda zhangzhouensis]
MCEGNCYLSKLKLGLEGLIVVNQELKNSLKHFTFIKIFEDRWLGYSNLCIVLFGEIWTGLSVNLDYSASFCVLHVTKN